MSIIASGFGVKAMGMMRSMREFLAGGIAGALLAVCALSAVQIKAGALQTKADAAQTKTELAQAGVTKAGAGQAIVRTPQFEDASVKAWKTVVAPHTESSLHRHDHPRVVVALTSGRLDAIDDRGRTQQNQWEAGHAYWLPAMPAGLLHKDVNPGDKPMEVVVLEMEQEQ